MGFGNLVQKVSFVFVQLLSVILTFYTIKGAGKFLLGPSSVPYTFSLCYGVFSFIACIFYEVTLKSVTNNHYLFKLYRKVLGFLWNCNFVLIIAHCIFTAYGWKKFDNFEILLEFLEEVDSFEKATYARFAAMHNSHMQDLILFLFRNAPNG